MTEDFILLICSHLIMFWAGYKWGLHSAVMRIVRNFIDDPDHIRKTFNQLERVRAGLDLDEDTVTVAVTADCVNNQIYIYREDTGEFLAQGADIDTAIANCIKMTPGVSYEISSKMANKPEQTQP